jgi:two-component system sensor kinase FixL
MISLARRRPTRAKPPARSLPKPHRTERRRDPLPSNDFWESAPYGLAIFDRDHKLVRCNETFRSFSGKELNPYFKARILATMAQVFKTRRAVELELTGRRSLHSARHDRWRASFIPQPGNSGRLRRILLSVQDITDTRRAEDTLQRVIDHLPHAIVVSNAEGLILEINRQTEILFGYSRMELLGKGVDLLIPEDLRVQRLADQAGFYWTPSAQPLGGGEPVRGRRKNGDEIILEIGLNPVQTPEGRRVIASIVDISDRIAAEVRFRASQESLQRSQLELSHARRVSAVGELASSLAHELNQPLSAILSNAQAGIRFLKASPGDPTQVAEILSDIVADDKRAAAIISRLRTFIKKKDLEFAVVDLNKVLTDVAALIRSNASIRQIEIRLDLTENRPVVRGDVVQLQQIFLNLMLNAFDAMQSTDCEQRRMTVQTRRTESDSARVLVKDTGPGIPADQLEKVFQPFVTTKKEGLGMGLAIARDAAEAHGGRLIAENDPDGGAVFTVTLPLTNG